jgi:hypothetical protein
LIICFSNLDIIVIRRVPLLGLFYFVVLAPASAGEGVRYIILIEEGYCFIMVANDVGGKGLGWAEPTYFV